MQKITTAGIQHIIDRLETIKKLSKFMGSIQVSDDFYTKTNEFVRLLESFDSTNTSGEIIICEILPEAPKKTIIQKMYEFFVRGQDVK